MKHHNKNRLQSIGLILFCLAGILCTGTHGFTRPTADPVASSIAMAVGYAMCGQDQEAATTEIKIHDVRSRVGSTIQEKGFFLSSVCVTDVDTGINSGRVKGITVHRDKFAREIMTRFDARFQSSHTTRKGDVSMDELFKGSQSTFKSSQIITLGTVILEPLPNVKPETQLYLVPADRLSEAELVQLPYPDAHGRVMERARKLEGDARSDEIPRDYLVVVFFKNKLSASKNVELILSRKPGEATGSSHGRSTITDGWVMAVLSAGFAYDSGEELFINTVVKKADLSREVIAVYSTHSLARRIENSLVLRGYDPGPIDGRIDDKARRAIQSFEQDQMLHGDGAPSQALLRFLNADDLPPAGIAVRDGLVKLGYDMDAGDGPLSPSFNRAIRLFQKERFLTVDGKLTATLAAAVLDTTTLRNTLASFKGMR